MYSSVVYSCYRCVLKEKAHQTISMFKNDKYDELKFGEINENRLIKRSYWILKVENAIMEAAIFESEWRHNHLINHEKIKETTSAIIFCCCLTADVFICI